MWDEWSYPGVITVSTFQNINGGQVKGTFSGTLADSITTPNTTTVSGSFKLIRSFAAGQ